jgi:hypothetical protein
LKMYKIAKTRAFMFFALAVASVFALSGVAAAATVDLHFAHVGADSSTFQVDPDDGGLTDPVVWHFVLNQLDPDTPAGTIYVVFQNAGAKQAIGMPVGNGSTQHFYVGTPDHDILLSAYAEVDSEGYGLLVLSHVATNEPPGDDDDDDLPPPDDDDDDADDDDDDADDDDDFLEFTEEEESLPFTGGGQLMLLFGAGLAATTGITLRRISK